MTLATLKLPKGSTMTTSLDVSGTLPEGLVEVYSQIHRIAAELSVPLLIVGATARDIILAHGYNAAIERGTKDVDFGIEVQNWAHYECVTNRTDRSGIYTALEEGTSTKHD